MYSWADEAEGDEENDDFIWKRRGSVQADTVSLKAQKEKFHGTDFNKAAANKYKNPHIVLKNTPFEQAVSEQSRAAQEEIERPLPAVMKQILFERASSSTAREDEGLDDEFEEEPWIPPISKIARELKQKVVHKGGEKLTTDERVGAVFQVYFLFLKYFAYGLLAMSVLALPVLVLTYSGDGIDIYEQDLFTLYRVMLGNIRESDPNVNTMSVFGQELSLDMVSAIVVLCEVLQVLLFLRTSYNFSRKPAECCSIGGGSGLPPSWPTPCT